ncbi:protein IMPACT isoform X2 [Ornithorhynchus anatinus]|uniref:Protein IMPACT n=1 Tax=Ornithorhynchus anatinus TaxID=9258 RepID=A0A6I8N8M3_ORNAN|nr:protein IMPACT isoform X2 [Ornithorhynchus anatinus]
MAEPGQSQIDEIEALSSIYGDEWCVIDEAARIFCIRISDHLEHPKWTLCLQVILPSEYPGTAPPLYQLNAPWLKEQDRMELANSLEEIYVENLGESILYLWVEKIREVLMEKSQSSDSGPDFKKKSEEEDVDFEDDFILEHQPEDAVKTLDFVIPESQGEVEEMPPIDHGVPITDRRSTFQAHLAPVVTPKQVKMVLAKLYENKKIASATHNIYAYRIYCEDKQTFLQDCVDDGETAAGGRLLHLMQILNVRNVLVVVSRWYGGILLGPDRFKHINNCARNILVEQKYTDTPEESSKQLGKNKKQRKDKRKSDH